MATPVISSVRAGNCPDDPPWRDMAASRSLEEKETLRSVVFESAHPAELVAGHTLELRAQIQKGWTDEQFKISVESQRGPVRRLKWLAVSTSVLPLASHPLPQIIT
jgi:hypothetical protein